MDGRLALRHSALHRCGVGKDVQDALKTLPRICCWKTLGKESNNNVVISLSPTQCQPPFSWFGLVNSYTVPAARCSYTRMPGVADSQRGADVSQHCPASFL